MNWVLIRGLSRQKAHWHLFPTELKTKLGGDIFFLDLPGVGSAEHLDSPLAIAGYTDHLRQKLDEIKEQHPNKQWTLLAVSLGGMIGLDWINRYPQDFDHLVTINTSAGNLSSIRERLSPAAIQTIFRLFFSGDVYKREKSILELTTNHFKLTEEIINKWVRIDQEHPLKRKTFIRQLYAASRFKVPEKLPFAPLILTSKLDRLASFRCSEKLAKRFKTKAFLHQSAGHDLMLDDSEWIIEKIQTYLQKN